jgi:hypothetical protein
MCSLDVLTWKEVRTVRTARNRSIEGDLAIVAIIFTLKFLVHLALMKQFTHHVCHVQQSGDGEVMTSGATPTGQLNRKRNNRHASQATFYTSHI